QERTPTLAELRRQLDQLDLGGLPRVGPRPRRATGPHSIAQLAQEGEVGPRYQFETPLGQTAISQLARAVDTVLDRSVVIERFDASEQALRALERARTLGRAQSPFVQRALGLDRGARTAVFEAPSGASLADATPQLPPAEAVRLLKRLARAAAAIHEVSASHGAIAPNTVAIDDGAVPTVLAAGLGPVVEAAPADDVAAIVALVASIVGCEPTLAAFAAAVCSQVGARPPALGTPGDGEELYAAADAIDIAVLGALGAR
ncbi:MAG TPA: hypothetical protein VLX92_29290, partial [Kofleriaceae bacterium]|nr:hypothetical protein [Kofleriaceae bacterium]